MTKLLVLIGPTGVGKTSLSLTLARTLEGEIVSADSRLLYRGMDIGTAKPSPEERQNVPHHLIDVADPDDTWDLARYVEAARQAIQTIRSRGRLPLLVGGTGQYIRALVEGWSPASGDPDPEYRRQLEAFAHRKGSEALHARLRVADPVRASQLDHRNVRRIIRALEIIHQTGMPVSDQPRRVAVEYDLFRLGLTMERERLYRAVDRRVDDMLERGLVEEVRGLLAEGYSCELPSMSAIGYAQICAHLTGELDLDEAVGEIRRKTRQLIRHQYNWFKPDDPDIRWLEVDGETNRKALEVVSAWIENA